MQHRKMCTLNPDDNELRTVMKALHPAREDRSQLFERKKLKKKGRTRDDSRRVAANKQNISHPVLMKRKKNLLAPSV